MRKWRATSMLNVRCHAFLLQLAHRSLYYVLKFRVILQKNLSTVETWGYRFAAECMAEVAARTLTTEIPSYATIMELDRKVREFPIPEFPAHAASSAAAPVPTIATEELSTSESMGRFIVAHAREVRKSCSFNAPNERSRFVVSHTSLAPYTSKLLCTGYHRKPCQSTEESICAVVPCHLSGLFDYTADNRSTVY